MDRAEAVERVKQRIRNRLARAGGEVTKTELRAAMPVVRGEHYQEAFAKLLEAGEIVTEQRPIQSVRHGVPATLVRLSAPPEIDTLGHLRDLT